MADFITKDRYNTDDLIEIMKVLRQPDGCPWDREQTHRSIRSNVLEEAYEVADAIDQENDVALCEESGDLLLQVVFHAVMAEERGAFSYDDVVDGIVKKLVFRHPHVFGDVTANTEEEALDSWQSRKREEKHQETYLSTLQSVPKTFPSLLRSQKVYKRAQKAPFFTADVSKETIMEQLKALSADNAYDQLGDILLAVAMLARDMEVDAEECLERACDRFVTDFGQAEA